MGTNPTFVFENKKFLSYFKIEETTTNLNQVGRPLDLNPGPPECESNALPRSHLGRCVLFVMMTVNKFDFFKVSFALCIFSVCLLFVVAKNLPSVK